MITPKPCPFCGSTNISVVEGSTFRWVKAECDDCGATCGDVRRVRTDAGNETAAIEEWNKRTGETQ